MKQQWKYLENQFIAVTRNSYKKAVKLSNYHDAVLSLRQASEPLLVPIYNRYHPLHLSLVHEYNAWKSAGGSQEGQTLNLRQLLQETYREMNLWEINVQAAGAEFMKGTPNYRAVFMHGRTPFIRSSIDERINAYDTLASNMAPFPPLAAIRAEVSAAFAALDAARDAQAGAKGYLKTSSSKVEAARIAAMNMQMRNLSFAIDAFWGQFADIEAMFDVQTLRETRQKIFNGSLDPSENKAVLTHRFSADDELRLKNSGNADINFYLATTDGGTSSSPVSVAAHSQAVVPISDFGQSDLHNYRHLTAQNQSLSEATHYLVEIL